MEQINNIAEEITSYEQLDKRLREIRKKKYNTTKIHNFLSFIKHELILLKIGKYYDVESKFAQDSISLLDSFYLNNNVKYEDMLIRKDKIISKYEFRNTIKIPVVLTIVTGLLVILMDLNEMIKNFLYKLFTSSSEIIYFVINNFSRFKQEDYITILSNLALLMFIVIGSLALTLIAIWFFVKALILIMSLLISDKETFSEKYEISILNINIEEVLKKRLLVSKGGVVNLIIDDPIKIIYEFDHKRKRPSLKSILQGLKK